MFKTWRGRLILITGASRGLGKELFSYYLKNNFPVRGTYNKTLPKDVPPELLHSVDVTDFPAVESWIEEIKSNFSGDITLINCAGISYNAFAHKSDPEAWRQVIEVNLIGTYNCIRSVLPYMREQNHGRIITVSSVVAQMGVPGTTSYAASKAALGGLVKSLSKEFKGKNITANNINLGYFDAGMIEQVPANIQEDVKSKIPNGRFGKPSELYDLIEFLRNSPYTNGSSLDINGGIF
ncbi:MAG: SDR family NAD(P)-dependent oxidoreductase [Proteobacteria bacterium]|nr:MAG: SDR family NAD(P)-dependent oxidoreductase [Pseudomonadota bacterium]